MPTDQQPDPAPSDRHGLLRQVLSALLCMGVIATVVGLMSHHWVMGGAGVIALVATSAAYLRLPQPPEAEDETEPEVGRGRE